MNDELKQNLSSLMDGEIDSNSDQAVESLLASATLRKTWQRYHLIGDALNRSLPPALDRGLASRLAGDIAREPVSINQRRRARNRYFKPVIGLAIAASVCAIAILSIQQEPNIAPASAPVQIAESQRPQINTNFDSYTFPAATQVVTSQIDNDGDYQPNPQFNSYLVNYNEMRAAHSGVQGIIPYVRIIANDDEK